MGKDGRCSIALVGVPDTEVTVQVKITVEVDGRVVKQHLTDVAGTLEQMEEKVIALSRDVARDTLQSSVDAVEPPRPLFAPTVPLSATKAPRFERSSG